MFPRKDVPERALPTTMIGLLRIFVISIAEQQDLIPNSSEIVGGTGGEDRAGGPSNYSLAR